MKIAVQTGDVVDHLGFQRGYSLFKQAGFEAVDWNLDHAVKDSDLRSGAFRGKSILEKPLSTVVSHYEEEVKIMTDNGLAITQAHAPFPSYIRAFPDTLDYSIEILKRNIELCGYYNCKRLVIHGIPFPLDVDIDDADSIFSLNVRLYTSLIETADKAGVTVCLENLFTSHNGVCYPGNCGDIDEAVDFIDYLNNVAGKNIFGFCLDTGHANLLHNDFAVIIPKLGDRLACLHIHDNNGSRDQHLAPGTGTVDWNRFCASIRKINYSGDLSFETFNQTLKAEYIDEELILPWLRVVCETGKVFRNKISG
ncbi:MAG: sugar phosphate isomerase/epimerase [Clostridiales bacterium]|nr:sugar phosphate isomerase/epimerase [Clostridiales bacterium]